MADKLSKPVLSLAGNILSINDTSGRAAYFDILVNGDKKATIVNSNFILADGKVFRVADELIDDKIFNVKE